MRRKQLFPGFFKECAICRAGIYNKYPSYLWWQDTHFIRVCADCDSALMEFEWYERQVIIESVITSTALDRKEFVLK